MVMDVKTYGFMGEVVSSVRGGRLRSPKTGSYAKSMEDGDNTRAFLNTKNEEECRKPRSFYLQSIV